MRNRIHSYITSSKDYFKQFLLREESSPQDAICSITLTANQVYLVHAKELNGQVTIQRCERHPYSGEKDLPAILENFVKTNNLQNVLCCLVLQPEDFQLLVTDALPVTASEFQAAIRWKIKDLLRYPLQDVVIDSFALPKMKTNINKIMVVAAQESKLRTWNELISKSGLKLKNINIPDLALRNLVTPIDQEAVAFIYIQQNTIQLMIFYQQKIYVSRVLKFNLGNTEEAVQSGMDRLAIEIQRSLDYYLSLWDHPLPAQLLYLSEVPVSVETAEYLSQKLRMPVKPLPLNEILTFKTSLSTQEQANYLVTLGGTLFANRSYAQEINLYDWMPKKTSVGLNQKTVLVSYGAFALLLAFFYLVSLWHKHQLENEKYQFTQTMEKDQQELSVLLNQYPYHDSLALKKRVDELQNTYDKKIQILNLISPNANFSSYLTGLAAAIVPGIWLTEITFSRDEKHVTLKGYAVEPSLLENFYNRLAALPVFSNLSFSVNEVKQTGSPASFFITGVKR